MQRDRFELTVGILVSLSALSLFFLAMKVSGVSHALSPSGYVVLAEFDGIGHLRPRSPVSIAGVKIGWVDEIRLNPKTFKGRVSLWINDQYRNIPKDSRASIYTEGLLGGNYVNIEPGFDEVCLSQGDEIQQTQPALVLERLIGDLMFKISGDSSKGSSSKK